MQWLSQGTMPAHFDEHHHNVHLTNGQEMVSSAVSAPAKDKFKPLESNLMHERISLSMGMGSWAKDVQGATTL
jgi:hypothetical protein